LVGEESEVNPLEIAVIGAGYVGLTTSACLAKLGHHVTCIEKNKERLISIQQGRLPFFEPDLANLVSRGVRDGRLELNGSLGNAGSASIVIIAVGTPSMDNGKADLSDLNEVVAALAQAKTAANKVIAIKSTVPVGTTDAASAVIAAGNNPAEVVFNPEFLREGSAINDFFHPHRVIIGTRRSTRVGILTSLYEPLGVQILVTTPRTAEMIKYASNAFLATKVSFINQIAAICEEVGVDIGSVADGMGADPRISPHYLRAGIGFGGSCLPKDLRALAALARQHGVNPSLLDAVLDINESQRSGFISKVERVLGDTEGKTFAIFGLAFKGGTSDVRESPAIDIARRLLAKGATVRAFDPAAQGSAARMLPSLVIAADAYEAAEGADAILILTDWPEFERLDWPRLRQQVHVPVVFDGRGLDLGPRVTHEGFAYIGPYSRDAGRDNSNEPPRDYVQYGQARVPSLPVRGSLSTCAMKVVGDSAEGEHP